MNENELNDIPVDGNESIYVNSNGEVIDKESSFTENTLFYSFLSLILILFVILISKFNNKNKESESTKTINIKHEIKHSDSEHTYYD